MNLEELLRAEREVVEPNPLVDRTDALVSRVRRRRRVVVSVSGVVAVAALAITVLVLGQTLPREVNQGTKPFDVCLASTDLRFNGVEPRFSDIQLTRRDDSLAM